MAIGSVIIDSREPDWVQQLDFGAPAAVAALDAGDLWVATTDAQTLIIERKTPTDLLNTIKADRLFQQVIGMRERSPWCYLVITGDLLRGAGGKVFAGGRDTGWDFAAVQGALLTVQELGAGVLFAAGDSDFAPAVIRLANRDRAEMRIGPPRLGVIIGGGEAALAALPGLGPQKIKALLDYTGTPAGALSWLTWDWVTHSDGSVTGIGPGTKAAVRRALGLPDWAELAIVQKDNGQKAELPSERGS